MGNAETRPVVSNSNTEIKPERKMDETEILLEKISQMGKKLWREYHTDFLNKDFCYNVDLAYRNKLRNLSAEELRKINSEIQRNDDKKGFDVFLKYKPSKDERFIVDALKEDLIERFKDQKILFTDENMGVKGMQYIRPVFKQSTVYKKNNKKVNNNKQIGGEVVTPNFLNKLVEADVMKANVEKEILNKNILNKKNNNKNNRKNVNELETILKNIENNKKNNKQKFNKKSLNKKSFDKKSFDKKPFNKKKTFDARPYLGNKTNIKKSNWTPQENNNIQIVAERNNIISFPHCNSKSQRCELTKDELCKAIAQNYIVRSNIIAAIANALPRKDKSGKLLGGFCQNRIRALEEYKICLPPEFKNINKETREKQIDIIIKYINNIEKYQCDRVGGYYRILKNKEIEALMTSNNEFNTFYRKFTQQLKSQYNKSLEQLLNILEMLDSERVVNNDSLNKISGKAKEVLDDMYNKCQTNYVFAVLAYLRADLEMTVKMVEDEKELVRSLEKELS